MKVLLVKMSSMGDVLHTLPAITDLKAHNPAIALHWVVEANFAHLAQWHSGVDKIIPIEQRKWLKHPGWHSFQQWRLWQQALQQTHYDVVIDAQGLLKSAFITRAARTHQGKPAQRHGFDAPREPLAKLAYHHRHTIDAGLHAVTRTRQLFAQTFGYAVTTNPNFGIQPYFTDAQASTAPVVLIPGTTWHTKHWHFAHWVSLAQELIQRQLPVYVIWGSPQEKAIAQALQATVPEVQFADQRESIECVASQLNSAMAVVGVDTGFTHIAGALGTPTLALYGPTSSAKVGLLGPDTHNYASQLACAPCHKRTCQFQKQGDIQAPECQQNLSPSNVLNWLEAYLP